MRRGGPRRPRAGSDFGARRPGRTRWRRNSRWRGPWPRRPRARAGRCRARVAPPPLRLLDPAFTPPPRGRSAEYDESQWECELESAGPDGLRAGARSDDSLLWVGESGDERLQQTKTPVAGRRRGSSFASCEAHRFSRQSALADPHTGAAGQGSTSSRPCRPFRPFRRACRRHGRGPSARASRRSWPRWSAGVRRPTPRSAAPHARPWPGR